MTTKGKPSKGGTGSHRHTVDVRKKDCTCGKWTLFGIPCSHAQAVAREFGLDPFNMIQPCYSVICIKAAYEGVFTPLMDKEYWEDADFELQHCEVLRTAPQVGRPRTTRIPNEMDLPQARARGPPG